MKTAYVVSGVRTPFAKAGAELAKVHAADLGRVALADLLVKSNLPLALLGQLIDEVVIGNVGTPADAANIARVVAMKAGLPPHVPAYCVHRNCASGMEAVTQAALKIGAGMADVMVAGGTENMSQMPLMYNAVATKFFEKLSRAKSLPERLQVLAKVPLQDFLKPRIAIVEGLTDPFCGLNMGQTAEVLAKEFKISRRQQDEFAVRSHQRTIAAQANGDFKDEIAALPLPPDLSKSLTHDIGPRQGQSVEALAKLKPYFDRKFGTVTVGNACPITDGAAMLLIASEEGLKKLGSPKPLAKIRSFAWSGLEPERMGLGPVYASAKALKLAGLSMKDMGSVEINEAFAAQVLACLAAMDSDKFGQEKLGLSGKLGAPDLDRLNSKGGAIAMGHPVGATGARLVLTAALSLQQKKIPYALASLCIGGGQGGAVVLEAL